MVFNFKSPRSQDSFLTAFETESLATPILVLTYDAQASYFSGTAHRKAASYDAAFLCAVPEKYDACASYVRTRIGVARLSVSNAVRNESCDRGLLKLNTIIF